MRLEGNKPIRKRKTKFNLKEPITAMIVVAGAAATIVVAVQIKDWVLQSDTFSLRTVVVNGNQILRTDEVLSQIEIDAELRITDLDLEEIQYAIEAHPYVKAALVSRKFPSSLSIDVVERKPVAYISQSDKPVYAIDRKGFLLPLLKDKPLGALPVITGINDFALTLGKFTGSERVIKALDLLSSNSSVDASYYQNLSEAHFDSRKGFIAYFVDGNFPVYFGHEEFSERAEKNFVFFRQARKEKRYDRITYVDLRFPDQVVVKYR